MIIYKNIGNSIFAYNAYDGNIINDYYQYIVDLIIKILLKKQKSIRISLCCILDGFIQVQINFEHILVRQGGRSVEPNTPFGMTLDENGNPYYVRIVNYELLKKADIIIDYSYTNIHHVLSSGIDLEFSKKHVYIAPYNTITTINNPMRTVNTLTSFINTNEPRRKYLLNKLSNNHLNVSNVFGKDLIELYCKTKILINVHQTDHHHTFEELRCLPALQCKCIVISELSPLHHLIPYHKFIIFVPYGQITQCVNDVLSRYDEVWNSIFSNDLEALDLDYSNSNTIENLI
jgi:hypothetical protein